MIMPNNFRHSRTRRWEGQCSVRRTPNGLLDWVHLYSAAMDHAHRTLQVPQLRNLTVDIPGAKAGNTNRRFFSPCLRRDVRRGDSWRIFHIEGRKLAINLAQDQAVGVLQPLGLLWRRFLRNSELWVPCVWGNCIPYAAKAAAVIVSYKLSKSPLGQQHIQA
jgi:hypothetical protein